MVLKNFLSTRWGIVGVGAFIGISAALLQKLGNPGNMGICVACFERDISGALGLHRAGVVQYMRPEIIGFVLGSLIADRTRSNECRSIPFAILRRGLHCHRLFRSFRNRCPCHGFSRYKSRLERHSFPPSLW